MSCALSCFILIENKKKWLSSCLLVLVCAMVVCVVFDIGFQQQRSVFAKRIGTRDFSVHILS